jgi:hypothetical protein
MKIIFLLLLLALPAFAADEVFQIPSTTRKEGTYNYNATLKQKDKRIMSFVIQRTGFSNPSVTALIRVAITYPEGVVTCGIKIAGGNFDSPTSGQTCMPPSNYGFMSAIAVTIIVTDNTPGKTGSLSGAATVTLK